MLQGLNRITILLIIAIITITMSLHLARPDFMFSVFSRFQLPCPSTCHCPVANNYDVLPITFFFLILSSSSPIVYFAMVFYCASIQVSSQIKSNIVYSMED